MLVLIKLLLIVSVWQEIWGGKIGGLCAVSVRICFNFQILESKRGKWICNKLHGACIWLRSWKRGVFLWVWWESVGAQTYWKSQVSRTLPTWSHDFCICKQWRQRISCCIAACIQLPREDQYSDPAAPALLLCLPKCRSSKLQPLASTPHPKSLMRRLCWLLSSPWYCRKRQRKSFVLSQTAPGKFAASLCISTGIVQVASTGIWGRRPSLEDTGMVY